MGTQGQRLGILGVKLADNLGPQHTGGTHLGDLHEVVHADGPEDEDIVDTGIEQLVECQRRRYLVATELPFGTQTWFAFHDGMGQRKVVVGQLCLNHLMLLAASLNVVIATAATVLTNNDLQGLAEILGNLIALQQVLTRVFIRKVRGRDGYAVP